MKLALLVIDMQGHFEGIARGMNIVGNVVAVIEACHRRNVPVFFTQHHNHESEGGVLYERIKQLGESPIIVGTDDWKLIPEIAKSVDEERDTLITEKTRCNGIHPFESPNNVSMTK